MKKILILICLFFLHVTVTLSQLQKHDIKLGIGIYSSSFFDAVRTELLFEPPNSGDISKNINDATGAIYLTYRHFPIPQLSIGVSAGLERITGDILINGSYEGNYNSDFYAGAIETDYLYVTKPYLQIYSGIGFGIAYHGESNSVYGISDTSENTQLIYQLNLIGLRAGGLFGFFFEAGYGYKGMARIGINLQL